MIDMLTRLSMSVSIDIKHPREAMDKIMRYWVAAGLGVKKSVSIDYGYIFSVTSYMYRRNDWYSED